MSFPFEKLDVYKMSLVLISRIDELCQRIKGKIAFSFEDQLRRAILSVALNIAEGNGRWHTRDKQHFFSNKVCRAITKSGLTNALFFHCLLFRSPLPLLQQFYESLRPF